MKSLSVYNYIELAHEHFVICNDSISYLHLKYAELFKQFVMYKDARKQAYRFLKQSRNFPEIHVLAIKEMIFQNYYKGSYSRVDSLLGKIEWARLSQKDAHFIALSFYLTVGVLYGPSEVESSKIILDHMDPKDTVMKWIKRGWANKTFESGIKSFIESGEMTIANMALVESYKELIDQRQAAIAAIRLWPITSSFEVFGFEQDTEVIRRIFNTSFIYFGNTDPTYLKDVLSRFISDDNRDHFHSLWQFQSSISKVPGKQDLPITLNLKVLVGVGCFALLIAISFGIKLWVTLRERRKLLDWFENETTQREDSAYILNRQLLRNLRRIEEAENEKKLDMNGLADSKSDGLIAKE